MIRTQTEGARIADHIFRVRYGLTLIMTRLLVQIQQLLAEGQLNPNVYEDYSPHHCGTIDVLKAKHLIGHDQAEAFPISEIAS